MTAQINLWNVLLTVAIMGGLVGVALIVGVTMFALAREENDRPLVPWGARSRVERARAAAEIAEHEVRRESSDIMRLALEPRRQRVVKAIESGELPDPEDLPALGRGTPDGEALRANVFGDR